MNNKFSPIYYSIASDLRKSIMSGEYNPGDIIPSENEIAEKYGTSRVTARKGLDMLEEDGLISAWHGKGYYVISPEHNKFTLYFDENNKTHAFKFNKVTILEPPDEIKEALALKDGEKAIVIPRVVLNKGRTVAYDEKYIRYYRGLPLIEEEIKYADLPELAAAKRSPFTIHTDMEIGAEQAPPEIASALGCPANEHFLVVYRYIIDQEDSVVGYGRTYLCQSYGRLKARSGYERPADM